MSSTTGPTSAPAPPFVPNARHFTPTHHTDTYPFISPLTANHANRSVLITGASRGIGRATALAFAQAGASRIALAARSSLTDLADEVRAAAQAAGRPPPEKVLTLQLDVTSEADVRAAAATVEKEFGGVLDVLIANAGHSCDWVPIEESEPAEWWRTWEVNVQGVYLCARFFVPLLKKSAAGGTAILVSSVGALNAMAGASSYQASKLAVSRLAQFLDAEYGAKEKGGLTALSVHPGGVMTELAVKMPPGMHSRLKDTPEMAAHGMVWLSAPGREWLSGRFVHCGWDMEELEAKKDEVVGKDLLKFDLKV